VRVTPIWPIVPYNPPWLYSGTVPTLAMYWQFPAMKMTAQVVILGVASKKPLAAVMVPPVTEPPALPKLSVAEKVTVAAGMSAYVVPESVAQPVT